MNASEEWKLRVIEQHSLEADEFAKRYARLEQRPYSTCLAYR